MTDKEKALLNYYLTMLRNQLTKMLYDINIVPNVETEYEKLIDEINDIMKINIVEGDR